jgi:GST-like protein
VMNKRLADREFLAGAYSIADMAAFPWVVPYQNQGQSLDELPHLRRWFEAMNARPAVKRALDVGKELRTTGKMDDEAKKILFGQTAKTVA